MKDPCDHFPLWGCKEMEKSIALLAEKREKDVIRQLKITEAETLVFICSRQEQMRPATGILLCLAVVTP